MGRYLRGQTVVNTEGGPSIGPMSIIRTNIQEISTNLTVPDGINGMTAGPVRINPGFTVTVAPGGNWSIV